VSISAAAPATAELADLLLTMADDELVIGFTDSEWTGIAPLLEEDVAMSSIAQDELGHAAALYGLLGELTDTDVDALAYDREPDAYRHCRLLDHGRGDWAMTIARRYLYDTADAVRLEALAGGSWTPLADLVGKLIREERYHLMHAGAWLERLARDSSEGRPRVIAALEQLGGDAATVFAPLPGEPALVDTGIMDAPMAELERRWRDRIEPILTDLGLPRPPAMRNAARARFDHGEPFRSLHAGFTAVRRSDPGATW
jgi:ring-1,2-phenylacetyl-CoA epoxidase subunit PaaC